MSTILRQALTTLNAALAHKAPPITPRDFMVPLRAVAVAALLSGCGDHEIGCKDIQVGDTVTVNEIPGTVVDLNRETIAVETFEGTSKYSCEAFAMRSQR